MVLPLQFEFAGIYYFYNDLIIPGGMKYHVYVGSLYELGEFEHYFFYINSKSRKIYAPHHTIYGGDGANEYSFLKRDKSFIGCRKVSVVSLPKKIKHVGRLRYEDMRQVVKAYSGGREVNKEIIEVMGDNLEYDW